MSPPPPAAAEWREVVEHLGQRIGRVGVVDDHRERLPGVDALHPAGHAGPPTRGPPARVAGPGPSASPTPTAASALWTLKRPASLHRVVRLPSRGVTTVRRSPLASSDRHGAHVRRGSDAITEDLAPASVPPTRSRPHIGSSALTHRPLPSPCPGWRSLTASARKGVRLAARYASMVLVELEVLVGDVGQDRHVVGHLADTVLGQPVGRRLDHSEAVADATMAPDRPGVLATSGVVARPALPRPRRRPRSRSCRSGPSAWPRPRSIERARSTRSSSCRPCR